MASRWLAVDKTLFCAVIAMIGLGLVMVYSASFPISQRAHGHDLYFVTRQAVGVIVGLGLLVAGLLTDYRIYRNRLVVAGFVAATVGALVLALFMPESRGAHRWIPLGPLNAQPSEIAKLAVILFLASYLSRKDEHINDPWRGLMPPLTVVAAIVFLIAIEPDLGTALMVMCIAATMLWLAGLSWKHVANVGVAVTLAASVQILRSGYQSRRIVAWLDPWADAQDAGYQTLQSLMAVGSGGFSGVGFAAGQQKSGFLPDPYTDFIYAVVAEEFGLLGASAVVLAFMVVLWRGLRSALRAPDKFGFYLGSGLTCYLVLQALVNMSIVVNLLPTTGIPLPLISYGGSSMVICCAAIGVLLNLSQHAHA
jgi:cell division protein FtsW